MAAKRKYEVLLEDSKFHSAGVHEDSCRAWLWYVDNYHLKPVQGRFYAMRVTRTKELINVWWDGRLYCKNPEP